MLGWAKAIWRLLTSRRLRQWSRRGVWQKTNGRLLAQQTRAPRQNRVWFWLWLASEPWLRLAHCQDDPPHVNIRPLHLPDFMPATAPWGRSLGTLCSPEGKMKQEHAWSIRLHAYSYESPYQQDTVAHIGSLPVSLWNLAGGHHHLSNSPSSAVWLVR